MGRFRVAWRALSVAAVFTEIATAAFVVLGPHSSAAVHPHFANLPFFHVWIRWDAGWYEAIAARGYTFSTTEQSAAAYFPLYPLLMRSLMALGFNVYLAGIFVTVVSGIGAAVMFVRWAS